MFDISNYNIFILITSFVVILLFLYYLFKSNIALLIDPLLFHIFWLSSILSFLVSFSFKYGVNIILFSFLIIILLYIFFLKLFLKKIKKRCSLQFETIAIKIGNKKLIILYVLSVLFLLVSKKPLIAYFLNHEPLEWFLYRFDELQGRDPFIRILSIGVHPIYYFLSFYLFFIKKIFRKLIFGVLSIIAILEIFGGGRSTLLHIVLQIGVFIFYYYMHFQNNLNIRKINIIGIPMVFFIILLAITVSSFYSKHSSFLDGIFIVFNRIFANGDGLEYYILYNGYDQISSGLFPYIMSIFGIYLKKIVGIEYKNIGHQLSELVYGHELSFAQGPNYILPLQIFVLGIYSLPFYVLIISILTAKLRNSIPKSQNFSEHITKYLYVSNSFIFVSDPEYGFLVFISFFVVYYLLFYPIVKFKF